MSARMRARAFVWVALLVSWSTPSVRADPILYSTWGTVELGNEPDHQLQGVSNAPASPDPGGLFAIGSAPINPIDPFHGPAPPSVSNAPFDIHVVFNNSLPSLELKGVFNPGLFYDSMGNGPYAYNGTVTSVVSSDPVLNVGLPAPFADALSDPSVLALHMTMWDWSVSKLQIGLSSQELRAVPEPSTLLVYGMMAIAAVGYARSNRARP